MVHLTDIEWYQKWKKCETDGNLESIKDALVTELGEGSPLALKSLVHLVHLVKSRSGDAALDWKAVYTISLICCQNVDCGTTRPEFDKLKFLNTMYHLIRCYVDNNLIKESLHLRSFIMLTKNNSQDIDHSLSQCYVLLSKLFHNVAIKMEEKYIADPCPAFYIAYLDVMKDCVEILTCTGARNLKVILNFASRASVHKREDGTDCLYKLFQFQYDVLCLPKTLAYGYESNFPNDDEVFRMCTNLLMLALDTCHKMKARGKTRDVIAQMAVYKSLLASDPVFAESLSFLQETLSVLHLLSGSSADDLSAGLDRSFAHLSAMMSARHTVPVEAACHGVSRALTTYCLEWWGTARDDWNGAVTVEVLTRLHLVLLDVAEVLRTSAFLGCRLGDDGCPCTLSPRVVSLVHLVAFTVNVAVNNRTPGFQTLLPQAEVALQQAMDFMAELRDKGCVQWDVYWKAVASTSFNLAVACSEEKLWNHSKNFSMQLCLTLLQDKDLECKWSSLVDIWQCFRILSTSYAGLGKYRNSLIIYALALSALPDKQDSILKAWCTIKRDLDSGNKLQSCTLHNIYSEDVGKLEHIYPGFRSSRLDMVSLLGAEAAMYVRYGLPPLAVSAVLSHLAESLGAGGEGAGTVPALLEALFATQAGRLHAVGAAEVARQAVRTLAMKAGPDNLDASCALAQMCYWKFKCCWTIFKSRLATEMNNTPVPPAQTDEPDTIKEPESDGGCKVTPAFNALTVANEWELLAPLGKAVGVCSEVAESGSVEARHAAALLPVLEAAADTFALFGCDARTAGAWTVHYRLARIAGDRRACIIATSNLIGSLPSSGEESWWQEVSAIESDLAELDKLGPKDGADKYTVLVSFWLGKSLHCLGARRYAEGKRYLQMAQKELPYISYNDRVGLEVRASLLMSHYLALPHSFLDTGDLKEATDIEAALVAHQKIQAFIKENKANLSSDIVALNLFLEAVSRCAELFLGMRWPKIVHIIVAPALHAAQIFSLATRSAQLLTLLARADLLTWNVVVARGSLSGLRHVLGLDDGGPPDPVAPDPASHAPSSPLASPSLEERPFRQPAFVSHRQSCRCCVCANPAVQRGILNTAFLQAHLLELCGKARQASGFYVGALRLEEMIDERETKTKANGGKEVETLVGNVKLKPVWQTCEDTCTRLVVSYADFLAVHSKYSLAMKYNNHLQECRNTVGGDSYLHLVQEAMEQKCALLKAVTGAGGRERRLPASDPDECEGFKDARTPTGGKSRAVSVGVSGSTRLKGDVWFYGGRERTAPALVFDLSSSDEDSPPPQTPGKPRPKLVLTCATPKKSAPSPFADIGNIELDDEVFTTPRQIVPAKPVTGTSTIVRRTKKAIFFGEHASDQENRRPECNEEDSPLTKSLRHDGKKLPAPTNDAKQSNYRTVPPIVNETKPRKDNCQRKVVGCTRKKVAVTRPTAGSKGTTRKESSDSSLEKFPAPLRARRILSTDSSDSPAPSDSSLVENSFDPVSSCRRTKVAKENKPAGARVKPSARDLPRDGVVKLASRDVGVDRHPMNPPSRTAVKTSAVKSLRNRNGPEDGKDARAGTAKDSSVKRVTAGRSRQIVRPTENVEESSRPKTRNRKVD